MKVFYVPGDTIAIDYAAELDGRAVSRSSGETLEQLAARYPGVTIGTEDEFLEQQSRALRTAPQPITEAEFIEALEVLPPLDWQHGQGGESFKMSEFYAGNVTTIYARRGAQHFRFRDVATLSHAAIMARLRD